MFNTYRMTQRRAGGAPRPVGRPRRPPFNLHGAPFFKDAAGRPPPANDDARIADDLGFRDAGHASTLKPRTYRPLGPVRPSISLALIFFLPSFIEFYRVYWSIN